MGMIVEALHRESSPQKKDARGGKDGLVNRGRGVLLSAKNQHENCSFPRYASCEQPDQIPFQVETSKNKAAQADRFAQCNRRDQGLHRDSR